MLRAMADTHAIIWYLFADPRLSDKARTTIEEAAVEGDQIALSSITLAEIVYLSEKGRIVPVTFLPRDGPVSASRIQPNCPQPITSRHSAGPPVALAGQSGTTRRRT